MSKNAVSAILDGDSHCLCMVCTLNRNSVGQPILDGRILDYPRQLSGRSLQMQGF
ncbi:MAG TPA: hypothetical protein V6C90_05995 [Coleofasciculaceae cyanobacterium]